MNLNLKNGFLIDEKETFNEKIRDYSQGSIKSYEVLNTYKEGGFYKVEAKFYVVERIRCLCQKNSLDQKNSKGLFAKIITDTKESSNKIDFLKIYLNT